MVDLLAFRILWFLVVAAATVLFVAQVGLRIRDYFDYSTNVGVDVKFVPKIEFPSVTICNENNHRFVSPRAFSF